MPAEVERLITSNLSVLARSPMLEGLSLDDESQVDKVVAILDSARGTDAWWAYQSLIFLGVVQNALCDNDAATAVWAMACAERCRSMLIFKEHLEDVVLMGQSAKRVVDILQTWQTNQENSDEEFWQRMFTESSYALSQVFAAPLVFIQDRAYVGGMKIDRSSAKFADFLFAHDTSREAVLVEIKTPIMRLLGRKYRGTYSPATELTGAVAQVLDYRRSLVREQRSMSDGLGRQVKAFFPKCVVVAGNGGLELDNEQKRAAFEDFRSNSRDVEIITYDELFRKIEVLASLFSLTRPASLRPE